MNFRRTVLFIAVAAIMLPGVTNAAETMKPGKWSVTMETEMAGMPMKMPATTMDTCVTPEQAAKPEPPKGKRESDCSYDDYKLDGNTVSFKINCPKTGMTGETTMTFGAESWNAESHIKMKDPRSGETMDITQKMNGKYVGPACEAKKK